MKTGNMIPFGGTYFKRLIRLQKTTGVKYFTKKDIAVCTSCLKKTGGVYITEDTKRPYMTYMCIICYQEFNETDRKGYQLDDCKHEMCVECATNYFWKNGKNQCPLCRTEINTDNVFDQLGLPWSISTEQVFIATRNGDIDKVKKYIDRNGDVNAVIDGVPLLHEACYHGHIEIAKLLINNNADVNFEDGGAATALHVTCYNGLIDITKLLIDSGADVNVQDVNDETPLYWCCVKGYKEIALLLIDNNANVHLKNNVGATALHEVCLAGNIEIARLLIDNGANVKEKNSIGATPLHVACINSHIKTAEILIDNGADINAKSLLGVTALHEACYNGRIDVVKFLIDKGADINIEEVNGKGPMDFAKLGGHNEIVDLLLRVKGGGTRKYEKTKQRNTKKQNKKI